MPDRHRTKLIGGYVAELTTAESNAWAEHVRAQPEYRALIDARANLAALKAPNRANPTHNDLLTAELAEQSTFEKLYQVGKDWYQASAKRRAKVHAAELERDTEAAERLALDAHETLKELAGVFAELRRRAAVIDQAPA